MNPWLGLKKTPCWGGTGACSFLSLKVAVVGMQGFLLSAGDSSSKWWSDLGEAGWWEAIGSRGPLPSEGTVGPQLLPGFWCGDVSFSSHRYPHPTICHVTKKLRKALIKACIMLLRISVSKTMRRETSFLYQGSLSQIFCYSKHRIILWQILPWSVSHLA